MQRTQIYLDTHRTNISHLKNKSGVYKIYYKIDSDKPVYVGSSISNLYRTITRHFQKWRANQKVISFKNMNYDLTKFYLTYTITKPDEAFNKEKIEIKKLQPKFNTIKYDDVPF